MALSQMVSRILPSRRLGYGIETRDQNARSGFQKLYILIFRMLIGSPWMGIQTIRGIEYRKGPRSVPSTE